MTPLLTDPSPAGGRPVIASVSGGKDSTALCLHLKERGIAFTAVHMDTGWEHPSTDEYIRETLDPLIGPIEWISPPLGFAELCIKRQMFPSRLKRFCTSELKIKPILRWAWERFAAERPLNAVGIRADESRAREELDEYEDKEWFTEWRPLIRWTFDDVRAIHQRHNLRPAPLYLMGASRVGCWPCIFARKSEIAALAKIDPARIDDIRDLEARVQAAAKDGGVRTLFHSHSKEGTIDIDAVVKWATCGHQQELFHNPEDYGCTRWGFCDTGGDE